MLTACRALHSARGPMLTSASHLLPYHRSNPASARILAAARAAAAAGPASTQSTLAVQHGSCPASQGKHYVVVGAGLAGLATAYHLLAQETSPGPVRVTLYDAVGIGAGGSGAAAGLLHPFAPTGKLLWRAEDAMSAALELLAAAEAAAARTGMSDPIAWRTGMLKPATGTKQSQSFWTLYSTQQQQQQQQQWQPQKQHQPHQQHQHQQAQGTPTCSQAPAESAATPSAGQPSGGPRLKSMLTGSILDVNAAQQLLPGVQLPATQAADPFSAAGAVQDAAGAVQEQAGTLHSKQRQGQQQLQQQRHSQEQQQRQPRRQQRAKASPEGWAPERAAALHVQGGITLQPLQYMQALWDACQHAASARQDGSSIQLEIQQLHSLADILESAHAGAAAGPSSSTAKQPSVHRLQHAAQQQPQQPPGQQQQQHHVHAIVVAAGAAVGSLQELGQQPLPLTLCQGYTLDMVLLTTATSPAAVSPQRGSCDVARGPGVPLHASATAAAAAADGGNKAARACGSAYPADAPSLLGSPYLASQGGRVLVVGATKKYACSTQQAVSELGRVISLDTLRGWQQGQGQAKQQQGQQQGYAAHGSSLQDAQQAAASIPTTHSSHSSSKQPAEVAAEVSAAADELLAGAAAAWPPIQSWSVSGIRSGVRALPPRSAQGAVPIAGCWGHLEAPSKSKPQQQQHSSIPVWLLVGLGARGLVYHAWLGKLTAAAVLNDSEAGLPPELLGWRTHAGAGTERDFDSSAL